MAPQIPRINSIFSKFKQIPAEYRWLLLMALSWLGIVGLFGWAYSEVQAKQGVKSQSSLTTVEADGEVLKLLDQPLSESTQDVSQIVVNVTGAVKKPGIYYLPAESLVAEAISQAGGFDTRADQDYIHQQLNLAEQLTDHQHLWIPFSGQVRADATGKPAEQVVAGQISINQASQAELETLKGIGQSRASKIIEQRPYDSIQDLVSLKIISQNLLDELQELITL